MGASWMASIPFKELLTTLLSSERRDDFFLFLFVYTVSGWSCHCFYPPLLYTRQQWSKSAADQALRWAKECNDGSSPHGMMDPDYGQNVGRSYYTTRPSDDHFLTVIVTKGWFNERSIYDPNTNKCTTSDGNGCGHFKTVRYQLF